MSQFFNICFLFSILLFSIKTVQCERERSLFKRSKLRNFNNSLAFQNSKQVNDVLQSMVVKFFKNGIKTAEKSYDYKGNILKNTECSVNDKFSIVLHGWIQSCDDDWVAKLIDRLTFYRGGCIICIDYSTLASASYMQLYGNFHQITKSMVAIILSLIDSGFNVKKAYMFGFSFGGQLASAIGRELSPTHVFKNIDTCDMAGPGFDAIDVEHRSAAKHVQCFHTSRDKGTRIYSCHRNIILGNCGYDQPAVASQPHIGSHGLCFHIYINSFDHPFYALEAPPPSCITTKAAVNIPEKYTIGYDENFENDIYGEIFVPTSLNFPYNLSERELAMT